MFTRTIEVNLKTGNKPVFFKTFKAEVMPILKKTPGFLDIVVLENVTVPTKVITVSFWETQKHAETYEKEWYPKVKAILDPFFAIPPVVGYYTVEETFTEKLFSAMVAVR